MDCKNLPHFTSLDTALASLFGNAAQIKRSAQIAGGDINEAYGLTLTDGTQLFMKSNARDNQSFFIAEAAGLTAIAQTGMIGTPHLFCTGTDADRNCSFLLMEFISGKNRCPDYWEVFAHQLAAMHQADTTDFVDGGIFGFGSQNYIGASHQVNTPCERWVDFFRDCRLAPQFEHASHYFSSNDLKKINRLMDKIGDILVEPEYPSLLHGDLWSGNFMTGSDGRAWLIDPAVYVGHAEADLAMTELFGGFPQKFYGAYREAAPLQPGYDRRRDLYNLYHLLNHLNLFGRSYLSSVKRIVEAF